MSTLTLGTIQSNTTSPPTINNSAGTEIGTFCRAWVNFNGTGTVAIRASFNVSSITDNSVGNYTVNVVTAMPDANYCVQVSAATTGASQKERVSTGYSTTAVTVAVSTGDTSAYSDPTDAFVALFR